MKTSIIEVRDMLSALSVDEVEKRIGDVPGVESVTVNYAAGSATARYDETRIVPADIKSAVRQRGYESAAPAAAPVGKGPAASPPAAAPVGNGHAAPAPAAPISSATQGAAPAAMFVAPKAGPGAAGASSAAPAGDKRQEKAPDKS